MLGLRSSIQAVADLTAARDWYATFLGFAPYFDEPFYVGFEVGGYELGLMPEGEELRPSTDGTEVLWGVDDCAVALARAVELGATELVAPRDVGGGIIVAGVRDPFGNRLGFIYNPHFKVK